MGFPYRAHTVRSNRTQPPKSIMRFLQRFRCGDKPGTIATPTRNKDIRIVPVDPGDVDENGDPPMKAKAKCLDNCTPKPSGNTGNSKGTGKGTGHGTKAQ